MYVQSFFVDGSEMIVRYSNMNARLHTRGRGQLRLALASPDTLETTPPQRMIAALSIECGRMEFRPS